MTLLGGVDHLHVITPDLDRLLRFYRAVFDAPTGIALKVTVRERPLPPHTPPEEDEHDTNDSAPGSTSDSTVFTVSFAPPVLSMVKV